MRLEKHRLTERIIQFAFSAAGMAAALLLFLVIIGVLPGLLPTQTANSPGPAQQEKAGIPLGNAAGLGTAAQPTASANLTGSLTAAPAADDCAFDPSLPVEMIPAPEKSRLALFQRRTGRLAVEDAQGNQVCLTAAAQAQNLVVGSWSPDSRRLLFWQGWTSASAQADGLPLWVFDTQTQTAAKISDAVLVNPAYSSWAPDGKTLAFTEGGYRSAQIKKRLSLIDFEKQQTTVLIPADTLVTGALAAGDNWIAAAAVVAEKTGPEFADSMGWDNPAILARRIYLVNAQTGAFGRLNLAEEYQDAPRWGLDGRLYYVQMHGSTGQVWSGDPRTGSFQALEGCQAERPTAAGYYGQVDWQFLYDACPALQSQDTTAGEEAAPQPVPGLDAPVPSLAVDGNLVYTGAGDHLIAIDITDPSAPQLAAQSVELPGEVLKVIRIPAEPAPRIAASAGRYLAVFDRSTRGELSLLTQSKLPGPIRALILDLGANQLYAGGALQGDPTRGFVVVLDASHPELLYLLDTVEMDAPVRSLALADGTIYAALAGDAPGVAAVPVSNGRFRSPTVAITNIDAASMTAVRGVLYIGSSSRIVAYDLAAPVAPRLAWEIDHAGSTPLPGIVLGFEVRASLIFAAGVDVSGRPFRMAVPLAQPIQTGSMVDTASYISAAGGRLLVASLGNETLLEVYDSLDPQNLKLLGNYPARR
jgi:hypothetical protein